jgi:hypothetical protein
MKALVCLAQKLHLFFMKKFQNLLSLIFLMAFLPASASAVTITISALNDEATTLDVTMTGNVTATETRSNLVWNNFATYVSNDGPNDDSFTLTEGITANGVGVTEVSVTELFLDRDDGVGNDDFWIISSFVAGITYSFSGSGTINLLEEGSFNFGDLIKGTYDLDLADSGGHSISSSGNSLVIQYSSVPDTGSTAALLGVGVFALAAARRRLG